jgi:HK97 family phage portal protein
LLGYSPLSLARQAIGLSIAAEAFGAAYWRNASRPSGVLSTDKELTPDAIGRMRESWEARMKGVQSAGAIAVLEGGLKYQQISLSPQDSQWLEGRAFQREEICAIYRVPPSVVGLSVNKQSYASAEQSNREWVTNCLSSWAARLEAEARRKLFRSDEGLDTEISFDAMLRADLITRYRSFSIARQFGFMSVNEIRAEIGRNGIGSDGDVYLQPANMVPASNEYGGEQFSDVTEPDAMPDEPEDDGAPAASDAFPEERAKKTVKRRKSTRKSKKA